MMTALPNTLTAFLFYCLRPFRRQYIWICITGIIGTIIEVIQPYFLKLILDTIEKNAESRELIVEQLVEIVIWFIALRIAINIVWYIRHDLWGKVTHRFRANVRETLFQYVQKHSLDYFQNNFSGQIGQKITDAADSFVEIMEVSTRDFLYLVILSLGTLIVLFSLHPYISFALILWLIPYSIIMYFISHRAAHHTGQIAQARSVLTGKFVDSFANALPVKTFAATKQEEQIIGHYSGEESQKNFRFQRFYLMANTLQTFLNTFMLLGLLASSLWCWQQGLISNGAVATVITYSILLLNTVTDISAYLNLFFQQIGIAKQSIIMLNQPITILDLEDHTLQIEEPKIDFKEVTFQYERGKPVFEKLNLSISPLEKVGLVGHSGAGKSTFVSLLLRFYDIQNGTIAIDSTDISKVTQESLRRNIAFIPQDTSLFHRTLIENIRYGRPDASDEEIYEASKLAHAHEFIERLPEGYETLVGERGVKLSGGQRQRISIARAILKQAPILILDEATSSLDSESEHYIRQSLEDLMQERTVIVIAHRLSTIAHLDRILVFEDGRIIEDGSHNELLKREGSYAKLWSMQSGGFLPQD